MSKQDTRIITTIGPDAGLSPEQLADFYARQNGIVSGFPDLQLVEVLEAVDGSSLDARLVGRLRNAFERMRENIPKKMGKKIVAFGFAIGTLMAASDNLEVFADNPPGIPADWVRCSGGPGSKSVSIIDEDGNNMVIYYCPPPPPPTQPTIPPTQPTQPTTPTTPRTAPTTPTTPPPPLSPPTETTAAVPSTSVLGTNGEHIYPDITIDLGGGVTTTVINTAKETSTTVKDSDTLDSIDDMSNTPEVGVDSGPSNPGDTPPSNEGLSTSEKVAIASGAGIAILGGVLAFMVPKRRGNKEKSPETKQPTPTSGGRPPQSGGIPINRGGFSGPATTHRSIADK